MDEGTRLHRPSFAVIRARREGRSFLILVDQALDADRWMVRFPWLVGLNLPISQPDSRGLCDERESKRLDDLEDVFLDAADSGRDEYVYAGRVTGDGVRAVLLYTPTQSGLAGTLNQVAAAFSNANSPIEISCRPDPAWNEFRAIAGGPQTMS